MQRTHDATSPRPHPFEHRPANARRRLGDQSVVHRVIQLVGTTSVVQIDIEDKVDPQRLRRLTFMRQRSDDRKGATIRNQDLVGHGVTLITPLTAGAGSLAGDALGPHVDPVPEPDAGRGEIVHPYRSTRDTFPTSRPQVTSLMRRIRRVQVEEEVLS